MVLAARGLRAFGGEVEAVGEPDGAAIRRQAGRVLLGSAAGAALLTALAAMLALPLLPAGAR